MAIDVLTGETIEDIAGAGLASPRAPVDLLGGEGGVDLETGAPMHIRMLVGGAPTQKDRLATLRKYAPDAQPTIGDLFGGDNFIFTHPETRRPTLYNPRGPDIGDVYSVGREGAQVAGGSLGAIAGLPAGIPGVAAGSILGTAGSEELFNIGARALGGMEDTRGPVQRAQETGVIGATGLGGPAGAGGSAAIRGGIRSGARGGREGINEAVKDMAVAAGDAGVVPSVALATRNFALDAVENILSRFPGGAGVIRRKVADTTEAIRLNVEDIATRTAREAGVDPERAGREILKGIPGEGGFIDRWEVASTKLYNKLYDFVPKERTVPVESGIAILSDLTTPVPGAEATSEVLASSFFRDLLGALTQDAAAGGGLPFGVLQSLRTAVGKKLSNVNLVDDFSRADLKRVYAALSDDIRDAAFASGGDDGLRAFTRANSHRRAGMGRIDDFLTPLVRAGGKEKIPEEVYRSLLRGAEFGASRIRAVRKSMTNAQWRVVTAGVIRRLGKGRPGQQNAAGDAFSMETFLTEWNKLDGRAKDAIFAGTGTRPALDAVARTAERARESGRAFFNNSGTTGTMAGTAMFASIGAGATGFATGAKGLVMFPVMLAVSALGSDVAARLMTSRRFVNWLANGTEINMTGLAAHLGRLGGVAAVSDNETKQGIIDLLGMLQGPGGDGFGAKP
tara:strand:- start:29 stop:2065 length:2037 start_codon:yes stop_codon:yes gene_type:complete